MAEGPSPCHHLYAKLQGGDSQGASPENSRPPSRSGDAIGGSHAGERPHVRFAPGGDSLGSPIGHSKDHHDPSVYRSTNEANSGKLGGGTRRSFPSRMDVGIPGDISESLLSRHQNPISSEYADDIPEVSYDEKSYQQRSARI